MPGSTEALAATVAVGLLACASGVLGCAPPAGHERRGDAAYARSQYREALAEYRSAVRADPDARLWAKLGAAARHAGNLAAAAEAYLRLAGEDPTREDEAAEGLETVARSALRAGNGEALRSVVVGLQAIAPERTVGPYALALARRPDVAAEDLVSLLPAAIAAAPDGNTVDSLLAVYGAALRESGGCDPAVPVFRAALRRSEDVAVRQRSASGLADCALELGERAEAAGDSSVAGQWFGEVVRLAAAPEAARARAAARLAQLGAADSLADSARSGEI